METKSKELITECCGAFLDVGSVIAEEDNVLKVTIEAAEAEAHSQFDTLHQAAKAKYDDVVAKADWDGNQLNGSLTFSCAAEKLIFEMANG